MSFVRQGCIYNLWSIQKRAVVTSLWSSELSCGKCSFWHQKASISNRWRLQRGKSWLSWREASTLIRYYTNLYKEGSSVHSFAEGKAKAQSSIKTQLLSTIKWTVSKFSFTRSERWDDHFLAILERDFCIGWKVR